MGLPNPTPAATCARSWSPDHVTALPSPGRVRLTASDFAVSVVVERVTPDAYPRRRPRVLTRHALRVHANAGVIGGENATPARKVAVVARRATRRVAQLAPNLFFSVSSAF